MKRGNLSLAWGDGSARYPSRVSSVNITRSVGSDNSMTSTHSKISLLANGLLVLCAVATTAMVAQSRFGNGRSRPIERRDPPAIANWQPLFERGRTIGVQSNPAAIVVFSDYECPACKALNERLRVFLQAPESSASVVYRHLPLPSHRFAEHAAVASECAAAQQKFEQMHNMLFEAQATLRLITWRELARRAGVPDLPRFDACMLNESTLQRVRTDVAIAKEAGMLGTPTVVFRGGRQYTGVPSKESLDSILGPLRLQGPRPRPNR